MKKQKEAKDDKEKQKKQKTTPEKEPPEKATPDTTEMDTMPTLEDIDNDNGAKKKFKKPTPKPCRKICTFKRSNSLTIRAFGRSNSHLFSLRITVLFVCALQRSNSAGTAPISVSTVVTCFKSKPDLWRNGLQDFQHFFSS